MRNKIALASSVSCQLKAQRGISLILVLFLIVVVSLLAAAMAQLNRGGSNSVGIEIQSTRALFAAESGAQIAAMNIFPLSNQNHDVPASCTSLTRTFTVAGLTNCNATVTCSYVTPAGAPATNIYKIDSVGVCGNGVSYARRKITVEMRSL